jgi:ADP-ribose pyrophosphatase
MTARCRELSEETVHSERIYQGRVVGLRIDTVRLANGHEVKREIVEHDGVVAIVPVHADGQILLVRQYRLPARATLLEIPAGGIDPGESPEDAVQRELQEETGYRAQRLSRLTGFWVAPGYSTEFIHVFLAEDLVESRLDADDDESIELERYPFDEALALVDSGAICDAKSIIGLLYLARKRYSDRERTGGAS